MYKGYLSGKLDCACTGVERKCGDAEDLNWYRDAVPFVP